MERKTVLKDVPEEQAYAIRKDFESEGAKTTLVRQSDGKWTVLAEFPDETATQSHN